MIRCEKDRKWHVVDDTELQELIMCVTDCPALRRNIRSPLCLSSLLLFEPLAFVSHRRFNTRCAESD